MAKPGEKVILTFTEIAPERYHIIHLNKLDPRTPDVLKGVVSRDVSIAEYGIGRAQPGGYLIGKRYDSIIRGIRDVLVVPKGGLVEEKLYNLVLKEAQDYAKEEKLEFEDHSNFQRDPSTFNHFYKQRKSTK
jgi:hypothetical protein